ncbi:MAG: hypothetical protein DRR19_18530 [Candidatus Parabeggiatoa sp. nov. 1]|nr:MAG: hypothetical protein DRR19_18530 [Gammaproteobacteria bacterium]
MTKWLKKFVSGWTLIKEINIQNNFYEQFPILLFPIPNSPIVFGVFQVPLSFQVSTVPHKGAKY